MTISFFDNNRERSIKRVKKTERKLLKQVKNTVVSNLVSEQCKRASLVVTIDMSAISPVWTIWNRVGGQHHPGNIPLDIVTTYCFNDRQYQLKNPENWNKPLILTISGLNKKSSVGDNTPIHGSTSTVQHTVVMKSHPQKTTNALIQSSKTDRNFLIVEEIAKSIEPYRLSYLSNATRSLEPPNPSEKKRERHVATTGGGHIGPACKPSGKKKTSSRPPKGVKSESKSNTIDPNYGILIVIEGYAFNIKTTQSSSVDVLFGLGAALRQKLKEFSYTVAELAPKFYKEKFTGYGNADKKDIHITMKSISFIQCVHTFLLF